MSFCTACETHHADSLPCPIDHHEALAKIEELEAEIADQVFVPVKLENLEHLWNSVWLGMLDFKDKWTGRPQDKFYEHFHEMKRLVMENLK